MHLRTDWRCVVITAVLLLGAAAAAPAQVSDFIMETADLGPTGQVSGYGIHADQMIGARFFLPETYMITSVGAHLVSADDPLFAAIVPLDSPTGVPQGTPFNPGEVIAFQNFTYDGLSDDVTVPLTTLLPSGDYGVIFGGYLPGGFGNSAMPGNNPDLPGASRFYYNGVSEIWVETGGGGARLWVQGYAVPETEAFLPVLLGLVAACRRLRRRPTP